MYLLCGAPHGRTLRDAFGKTFLLHAWLWLFEQLDCPGVDRENRRMARYAGDVKVAEVGATLEQFLTLEGCWGVHA